MATAPAIGLHTAADPEIGVRVLDLSKKGNTEGVSIKVKGPRGPYSRNPEDALKKRAEEIAYGVGRRRKSRKLRRKTRKTRK